MKSQVKIRGAVRKYAVAAVKTGATSNTMVSSRYKSPNMNYKDKVQLAAILRGGCDWSKAARKELFG
jgi:hypothetical protein